MRRALPAIHRWWQLLALAVIAVTAMVSCTTDDSADAPPGPRIVTTTTVLGDVLGDVVGEDGSVEVLLPVGADPHEFSLSARQAAELQEADLLVVNGLGFEAGLADAIDATAASGVPVLRLGEELDPIPLSDQEGTDGADQPDPHWFTDPVRMADAAELMGESLVEHTSMGDEARARAAAVSDTLRALDDEVRQDLDRIPTGDRRLVTDHAVFGYFADRYDLEVMATLVSGGSTLDEPSPAELTELAATIESAGVPALFVEAGSSHDLADALADELDPDPAVVELFMESLGAPGSAGDTYESMIRVDAERIATALSPGP